MRGSPTRPNHHRKLSGTRRVASSHLLTELHDRADPTTTPAHGDPLAPRRLEPTCVRHRAFCGQTAVEIGFLALILWSQRAALPPLYRNSEIERIGRRQSAISSPLPPSPGDAGS